jgi:hypothetical protein
MLHELLVKRFPARAAGEGKNPWCHGHFSFP